MAENTLSIDKNRTALVLIDLQKGIVGRASTAKGITYL